MIIRKYIHTLLLFVPLCSFGQSKQERTTTTYPQNYFRNPLDIPIFLAGNFGECRPGHFHSGIDIKTKGEENQPVHAAADGYISRIKMEKGGFGHGIYITHPNGYTTLYAHLNSFAPAIQQYVKSKQYEKQRWDVDLQFSPEQFPVKKGQLIAWSGNTGASTAPHLHFEIRNSKTEHPLNPELFGLPIVDEIAPVVKEVTIYSGNIYETTPTFVTLKKTENLYKPLKTGATDKINKDTVSITTSGTLGIGINADDFMNGSDNSLTFYTAKLYMDNNIQSQITLDDIGYDVTRYINAYADYKTKELHKKWSQCLFQLPGNKLNGIFSQMNANNGKIDVSDGNVHKIEVILTDDKNNESRISFYVKPTIEKQDKATLNSTVFQAGKVNSYKDQNISFILDETELYDDINFNIKENAYTGAYSNKYSVHYPYVPLHHYFDLMIKPEKPVPFALRSKMVLMYSDGKDDEGKAAVSSDNGWYKAAVRNFGTYWLAIDTIPPVIKSFVKSGANLSKASQILFTVKDEITSIKTFNGYIDNKWVCFEQHGSSFFYKFDEHCSKGKHELVFKAEDENGNATSYSLTFIR